MLMGRAQLQMRNRSPVVTDLQVLHSKLILNLADYGHQIFHSRFDCGSLRLRTQLYCNMILRVLFSLLMAIVVDFEDYVTFRAKIELRQTARLGGGDGESKETGNRRLLLRFWGWF